MKLPRRQFLQLAAGAAALPAFPRIARAQAYPTRPVTMVVPFPAGGPVDLAARLLSERMRIELGQSIIIDNVGGAGGSIGVRRVARATPDGHTLVAGNWTSHVGTPAVYPVEFDVSKDFEPVALLPSVPALIVGKKALPANNLAELIAWLKTNPNKATAATVGAGGIGQLAGISFQEQTGARFQQVPYRGGGPATQDLVSGHVDLRFGMEASQALPYIRSGDIKAFAVLSKTRLAVAPEIPTIDEAGMPGLYVSFWNAIWAPKGTPKDVVVKLNLAVTNTLSDPVVNSRFGELGQLIPPPDEQTPEALRAFHKAEIDKWWPLIKAAGIKPE